jgi:TonB family protein
LLHVHRRDWLWVCAEEFIRAVLWFHPGIWWLLNGIQLSREQVVDQQVVRLTAAREQYLKSLLQIINLGAWNRAIPAPLFLRERQLVRRVALILTEVQMARPRLIASLIVIGGLTFLCGLVVTSVFPLKAAPLPARLESENPAPIADESAGKGSPLTQSAAQDEQQIERPQKSPIRLKEGIPTPKVVHGVKAVYPPEAKQRGLQGVVVVEMTVNEKGRVWDARVIEGHPLLDPAALAAVREFQFTPNGDRGRGRAGNRADGDQILFDRQNQHGA